LERARGSFARIRPAGGWIALDFDAKLAKRPWYWLAVLAVAALLASWLVGANARSRIAQNRAQFGSSQTLRLQRMEQRIDDYFAVADQLVSSGAASLQNVRGDVVSVRKVVLALFRSRTDPAIYGVGALYAPYAFESRVRLFSVYDHPWDERTNARHGAFDRKVAGGVDEIVSAGAGSTADTDYTRLRWYRRAASAGPEILWDGPYEEDGRSFISTLRPFYAGSRLLGIMAVDTLTETFKKNLEAAASAGDVAWIESSVHGRRLLATSSLRLRGSSRQDRSLPLRYTGAIVHLSSDTSALEGANRGIVTGSVAAVLGIWIFALLLAVGLLQRWRAGEATSVLQLARAELETEIEIAKKIESELRKAAFTDSLTGLPNRAAFLARASAAIAGTRSQAAHAVYFIDLDRFNLVNDTLGHFAGDELLKAIATRLRELLPPEALVARLGGDEFVVVMPVARGEAEAIADRILAHVHEPMLLGGRVTYTSASIGIVLVEPDYRQPEELLRDVDIAMYAAKAKGRGCYAMFDTRMRRRVEAESDLASDLRRALERREFVVHYQPIVEVTTGAVSSLEALVRWQRSDGSVTGAVDFVGYAERRGLIEAIDKLVLEMVCRDAAALFGRFPSASVAVNVSAAHLGETGLVEMVDELLRARSVPPSRLKLEITETAVMSNADAAQTTLELLRRKGIQVVLDDFGSGHSSLAYLHRLPIAGLKIDRSFVSPLAEEPQAVAIVRSIVALAQTLNLYTVAEGVETDEQMAIVRQLGVTFAQGFLFSPALELSALLRNASAQPAG
jgi:diguanylate cyclase (GGDEF)-like protein